MFKRWHCVASQIGVVGRRDPARDLTVHKDCVDSQSGSTLQFHLKQKAFSHSFASLIH